MSALSAHLPPHPPHLAQIYFVTRRSVLQAVQDPGQGGANGAAARRAVQAEGAGGRHGLTRSPVAFTCSACNCYRFGRGCCPMHEPTSHVPTRRPRRGSATSWTSPALSSPQAARCQLFQVAQLPDMTLYSCDSALVLFLCTSTGGNRSAGLLPRVPYRRHAA